MIQEPTYVEYVIDEPVLLPTIKKKRLTKAEKKERKLKAEEEFKKQEIRHLLKRELELSKKTAKKYREKWENMCKEIKLKKMKTELVEWERKFQRVFEQKDRKIQLILDEVATTEEMHHRSYSTQLQIMDYLTDTFRVFEENAKLVYETEASEMLHAFYQEVEYRCENENRVKLNCENILHATNLIVEKEILNDFQIFLDKRDDRVNTEIEKRYRLRDSIMNKMDNLHEQLLLFLESLHSSILDAQKYERVSGLVKRQRNFVTESQKLNIIEEGRSRLHAELHQNLIHVEMEDKRKINNLKLEYAYFLQMRKNIEKDMKIDRENTHEKLKILTSESFKVIQKYQKLQKYGELLLSLAANCRKLQTESEKVVSWGDFYESKEQTVQDEPLKLNILDLKTHLDVTEVQLRTEIQLMENFWRRQAIVEAQIMVLEEKKRHLTDENNHYINIIKRMSKADNIDDLGESLKIQCMSR